MKHQSHIARFLSKCLLGGLLFSPGCGPEPVSHEPVSIVLEFQLDTSATGDAAAELQQQVVSVVNARLNDAGTARPVGKKRLKVDLYGKISKKELESLERRIGAPGRLQFRVLATSLQFSAKTIDFALASFPKTESPKLEWLPLKDPSSVDDSGQIVLNADKTYVLVKVLGEAMTVDSKYLLAAKPDSDQNGRPVLAFRLNETGARHMYRLTRAHRPAPNGSFHHRLAIIFEGHVISAPSIHEPLGARGQIPGKFTQAEVEDWAAIFSGGALPCAIQKIGHTTHGKGTKE